jgi:hypothetical protein
MTAQLAPTPVFRATDGLGLPLFKGQLTTYQAGTLVPQATYIDSTQTTPNTNPVILNARGECALWLDPTKSYKFALTDQFGNNIPGWPVDNINIGNANPSYSIIPTTDNLYTLGNASFSWANVFIGPNHAAVLDTVTGNFGYYARTAAEIAAGVTPANFSYPPLYVDRYATNTIPGTTDMSGAFTKAVKVALQGGGTVRWGVSGIYLTTAAIDCTWNSSANQNGVVMRPDVTNNDGSPAATILAQHNGNAVFDCTGNTCINFENVGIQTDVTTFPKVGFLFARVTVAGSNSQINRLTNCRVFGSFQVASFYNYGSEDFVMTGCYFANKAATAGSKVAVWTAFNISGLTSPFVTIRTGQQSMIDHTIQGCQFWQNSTDATADAVYVDGAQELRFYSCWLDCRGRALFAFDLTNAAPAKVIINGCVGENSSPLPNYGIFFTPNVASTPIGFVIDGGYFNTNTNFIFAPSNVILDNWYVRGVQELASHGISATLMRNSVIDQPNMALVLGTSQQNRLTGDRSNWTITTRSNDYWEDVGGAGTHTWTPVTTSMGVTGALTVNEARCYFHGGLVTLQLTCSAATSIVSTAGTNFISGLPAPTSFRSALVSVCNEATHVTIGTGMIDTDNKIWLPTINVGAGITITLTATYPVA